MHMKIILKSHKTREELTTTILELVCVDVVAAKVLCKKNAFLGDLLDMLIEVVLDGMEVEDESWVPKMEESSTIEVVGSWTRSSIIFSACQKSLLCLNEGRMFMQEMQALV